MEKEVLRELLEKETLKQLLKDHLKVETDIFWTMNDKYRIRTKILFDNEEVASDFYDIGAI